MTVPMPEPDDKKGPLDVSVRIASLNRPAFLREAIESVLAQTRPPKDIQVFDNGSQEDVEGALKDLISKGVLWHGSDRTRSPIWNFMRMRKGIDTKYVHLMHDDDRLLPEFLEAQVGFLERHPEVTAVACNAYTIDRNGLRTGRMEHMDKGDDVQYFRSGADVAMLYLSERFLPFPSIVYRTKALLGTRPPQKRYARPSDAVFICDLADTGPVVFQNRDLFEYRYHSVQGTRLLTEEEHRGMEEYFYESALSHPGMTDQVLEHLHRNQTIRTIRRWAEMYFASRKIGPVCRDILSNRPRFFSWRETFRYSLGFLERASIRHVRDFAGSAKERVD
jgi:glycosyltransferase involved in cell wall biosynthesis